MTPEEFNSISSQFSDMLMRQISITVEINNLTELKEIDDVVAASFIQCLGAISTKFMSSPTKDKVQFLADKIHDEFYKIIESINKAPSEN